MPRAVPVYQRIINDIKEQVLTGQLRPGDKLPSIKEMTVIYKCSGEPVKSALRTLSATGQTVGHQGRGVFIAGGDETGADDG